MDFITTFFNQGILGSLKSIGSIAIIVIPLMLFMEIAKDLKILDYIGKLFKPITKLFRTQEQAAFPLAVGIIFGISYGAGVLIKSSQEGAIEDKSLFIISVFLAACHAIVEDTLLFVAVGASGVIIICMRVIMAFVATLIISRISNRSSGGYDERNFS